MEKCWFNVRDTRFPPPSLDSMRSGHPSSPTSLGHLIPSLNQFDQIINADAIEPFPPTMEIHGPTLIEEFTWDQSLSHSLTLKAKVGVPLTAAGIPGVELGVGAGAAFSKSVANYWEFDRLERYIMRPTRSYVQKCIERDDVKQWIAKNKRMGGWEVYMITGIIVARGGGRKKEEKKRGKELFAEVTVQVRPADPESPESQRV